MRSCYELDEFEIEEIRKTRLCSFIPPCHNHKDDITNFSPELLSHCGEIDLTMEIQF